MDLYKAYEYFTLATYTGNVVYTDYIYDALKERYKDDYEREMGR